MNACVILNKSKEAFSVGAFHCHIIKWVNIKRKCFSLINRSVGFCISKPYDTIMRDIIREGSGNLNTCSSFNVHWQCTVHGNPCLCVCIIAITMKHVSVWIVSALPAAPRVECAFLVYQRCNATCSVSKYTYSTSYCAVLYDKNLATHMFVQKHKCFTVSLNLS